MLGTRGEERRHLLSLLLGKGNKKIHINCWIVIVVIVYYINPLICITLLLLHLQKAEGCYKSWPKRHRDSRSYHCLGLVLGRQEDKPQ